MIDLHYISHPTIDRSKHMKRVIRKLSQLSFITVHEIEGTLGDIGIGRKQGFLSGVNDFVTFINDDDDVEVSVIEQCFNQLQENPSIDAIVTKSCSVVNGKQHIAQSPITSGQIHNSSTILGANGLTIIRRSSIQSYLDILDQCPSFCEISIFGLMILHGQRFVHCDSIGYYRTVSKHIKNNKILPSEFTKDVLKQLNDRTCQNDNIIEEVG